MRALVLLAIGVIACATSADDGAEVDNAARPALDKRVAADMVTAGIPGLAAVVIKGNRIVYAHGYGSADLATGAPVTPDTVFNAASISKTVAAVAFMQQVDGGAIGLDDDIDRVLPFSARSPSWPAVAVTPRMLLSHTAGMADSAIEWNHYVIGMDSPISLASWLAGYLVPGGAYYSADSWYATEPGTAYHYANAGIDTAGHLVERLAGADLQTYSEAQIFAPLGMTETSWFLAGLERDHIAMPYVYGPAGGYVAWGYECYPDYPNGQLRTSARQLARFLMMFASGGELAGARVLSAAAIAEISTVQPNSREGLGWEWDNVTFGRPMIGHSGVDDGVSTDMWLDPETGAGFIVLTNSDVYLTHWDQLESGNNGVELRALVDLENALLDIAN